ncbi:deoxyribodipyrimidine photo-lyase-like [Tubulinosema ratisbonensis]|uniref:Deoxyribodipyrimidine photo-lyase n=1 Tax=Tubulinosema ratisbonensis TaxID=291195 RepID=A0A437APN2_9MICR|nr:deoxyribodipyrimidine photo-lyase-like [Tubulinosema ratisbonensis]
MDRSETLCDHPSTQNTLYLMRRDQRIKENHCIQLSYTLSKNKLYVLYDFFFIPKNKKQKKFILEGMTELIDQANEHNLFIKIQYKDNLKEFIKENEICLIVLDFCPLREYLEYDNQLIVFCDENKIKLIRCDAHNIVPCHKLTTYKRTGKSVKSDLYKLWDKFYKKYDEIKEFEFNNKEEVKKFNKETLKQFEEIKQENTEYKNKRMKNSLLPTDYHKGGYKNGMEELENFFKNRFSIYDSSRNNPEANALSNLSPWLHSGQISALKVVQLAVKKFGMKNQNLQTFLNEVFVWKETADHFCYHEKNYDNLNGALPWAKQTLEQHSKDKRPKIYSLKQLECGETEDYLWNAGQKQMVITGKMHGYVRMYWAKNCLLWSKTPGEALERAIFLNDKYSIDANDPNGYLGIMWSICGTMDQGWGEREVVGKIRSMKKFKCPEYISRWANKKIDEFIDE